MGQKQKNKRNVARIAPREAALKRRIRRHLQSMGFQKSSYGGFEVHGSDKDIIRSLHNQHRNGRVANNQRFLDERLPALLHHFASGKDVDPARITPVLERVRSDTEESELFRLASLTWSVPVSNGFGRRLRYLVRDDHNGKLIGLIAIGDPVFNLSVRDNLIGWDAKDRSERLVNIMDAYVLGALPPYNMLLGGKLVASLVRSRDIYDDFTRAYGGTTGIISGKEKKARLLAVTTSSSLGRSSVYNRLKLDGVEYFKSIGYTGGWGHFHITDGLFNDLREYLRTIDHPYADHHRFGHGPNWRLRTTRAAFAALGLKEDILKHGIQREVFLCELASNAAAILRGGKARPNLSTLLSASEVAALAVERWMLPRAERQPEYQSWSASAIALLVKEQRAKIKLVPSTNRRLA
ncbi:MAG: Druantia anti-phage system protein DruA [Hyphomicrobiaceae bacterium]